MENTPRETAEGPVLLSWEMPEGKRKLIVSLFWLLFAGFLLAGAAFAVYAAFAVTGSDPYLNRVSSLVAAVHLVGFWVLVLFLIPVFAGAYGIRSTNSGMWLSMFVTGQRLLRWDEIIMLRKGRLGHTIVQYGDRGRSYVYLNIPPDVRDKLIAILRETSNARIIGFEPEES